MTQEFLDLDKVIDDREIKIIICCGSGGVGKTTIAGARASALASRGLRVLVRVGGCRRGMCELFTLPVMVDGECGRRGRRPLGGSVVGLSIDSVYARRRLL